MEKYLVSFSVLRRGPRTFGSRLASTGKVLYSQCPNHQRSEASFRPSIWQSATPRLIAMCLIATVSTFTLPEQLEAQLVSYQTILLTGDEAPTPGENTSFRGFFNVVLNETGQLAFNATLAGAGVDRTNDFGIFGYSDGKVNLIARAGDSVSGFEPDVTFSSFGGGFGGPVLNNQGQTAFLATMIGTHLDTSNGSGFFLESDGKLNLVARSGDLVPGAKSSVNLGFLFPVVLNDLGQMAFLAGLTGAGVDSTDDRGIFFATSESVRFVTRSGDTAPVTELGTTYDGFDVPTLNDLGQVTFRASLAGSDVDFTNQQGFFVETQDSVTSLVRWGDEAPTTVAGDRFSNITRIARNEFGQSAFHAFVNGPGELSRGLFLDSNGSLDLLVRDGAPLPSAESGVHITGFSTNIALNNVGRVVFKGFLAGAGVETDNRKGIFSAFGDTLELVARTGDVAPDTEPGVYFSDFATPVLNDTDQIAFLAHLSGTGVDNSNDRGIFATDTAGNLRLVAREGDLFDVNPEPFVTEYRTISGVAFVNDSRGNDGRPRSFNNAGQLALTIGFTDFTGGLFVATIGVPEPTSSALFGAGCFVLLCSGKRQ